MNYLHSLVGLSLDTLVEGAGELTVVWAAQVCNEKRLYLVSQEQLLLIEVPQNPREARSEFNEIGEIARFLLAKGIKGVGAAVAHAALPSEAREAIRKLEVASCTAPPVQLLLPFAS